MIKFPYIKQEYRPAIDFVLRSFSLCQAEVNVSLFLSALKAFSHKSIDGCMNYIITKIVMNKETLTKKEKEVVEKLSFKVYDVDKLCYHDINAFTGLIDNVLDNLEERGWITEDNVIFLCELLIDYKEKYVRPYEKRKMLENSDLI